MMVEFGAREAELGRIKTREFLLKYQDRIFRHRMAWTKKCTETTFAGWKQQMNLPTLGISRTRAVENIRDGIA